MSMKVRYRINGKEVSAEAFRAHKMPVVDCGSPSVQGYSEGRPGKSIAMSVHPDQIPLMNAELRRHGIQGVHYDPSKRDNCIITSREGRKRWMRIFGALTDNGRVHDGDGGYGDG